MSAYGSFPRSLLLPEGGRCGTFLVCSCKSIVHELHTCTHASGSRRIQSLYLTGTLWPKHSINQHGKEGSKEGRSWGPSPKEGDYYLGKRGYAVLRSCWHASWNFAFVHHNIFSYTTLWMQPSGLSHLRLFPTETGVRYFVKSFVLCAEGHRHPQQGWVAARADYWPLKANRADTRKKWFNNLWIPREIAKTSSRCGPDFFPFLAIHRRQFEQNRCSFRRLCFSL